MNIFMSKKVALIILDWFGLTESNPDRNSIIQAKTPTFDYSKNMCRFIYSCFSDELRKILFRLS